MTLAFNIRRPAVIGLALLLFMAVIGPACLVAATQAMGMPMGSTAPVPMDCDWNPSDSASTCPHAESDKVVGDTARTITDSVDVAFVTAESLSTIAGSIRITQRAERLSSPPPSHLTPLRL